MPPNQPHKNEKLKITLYLEKPTKKPVDPPEYITYAIYQNPLTQKFTLYDSAWNKLATANTPVGFEEIARKDRDKKKEVKK